MRGSLVQLLISTAAGVAGCLAAHIQMGLGFSDASKPWLLYKTLRRVSALMPYQSTATQTPAKRMWHVPQVLPRILALPWPSSAPGCPSPVGG